MASLASFEWVALVYFVAVAGAATVVRVRWAQRLVVSAFAMGLAVLVLLTANYVESPVRDWLPHLYLVAGYWLPGLLARGASPTAPFEQWLVASDLRLRPLLPGVPAPLTYVTEAAYLLCYPLVPIAFAAVWTGGSPADVDRFWVAVLIAGYACYASLPWLISRPPRLVVQRSEPAAHIGAVNVLVLGRVSHQLNTFPSGHVAVSFAAAAGVASVSPVLGLALAAMATAIAVGAAAGRYHYVVDVVLGIVAAGAAIITALLLAP